VRFGGRSEFVRPQDLDLFEIGDARIVLEIAFGDLSAICSAMARVAVITSILTLANASTTAGRPDERTPRLPLPAACTIV
jgi:hypothetical protein